MTEFTACRRTLLRGAALAGVAGLGLTACAGGGDGADGGGYGADGGGDAPATAVELGPAAEVPVGGAKLYRDQKVVVSQPAKGTYKAYSAVCTHAGCVVDTVEKGVVSCPCHGSRFNAETGAVERGPAGAPLPGVEVRVEGGKLLAGPNI